MRTSNALAVVTRRAGTLGWLVLLLLVAAERSSASEALMEKSGCLSCHRVSEKLIGPAFKEIAARYRNQPDIVPTLLLRVREGNEGEWGDIPMAANSAEKVSDADLKLIVDWILTLPGR